MKIKLRKRGTGSTDAIKCCLLTLLTVTWADKCIGVDRSNQHSQEPLTNSVTGSMIALRDYTRKGFFPPQVSAVIPGNLLFLNNSLYFSIILFFGFFLCICLWLLLAQFHSASEKKSDFKTSKSFVFHLCWNPVPNSIFCHRLTNSQWGTEVEMWHYIGRSNIWCKSF